MPTRPHVAHEVRQAGRFGLVGLAATLLHLTLAQAALWLGTGPLAGNLIGFVAAFVLGLLGHYHFTFPGRGPFGRALRRYGAIAVAGFLVNNVVLIGLVALGWVSEAAALAIAILLVPALTFLASRFWGFSSHPAAISPISDAE